MAARPKRGGTGGGGAGSFLVVVGGLAVLGATFMAGVLAGRAWPEFPLVRSESAAKTPRERGREREARVPELSPTLTFYEELTAPLTSPPPSKPSKPPRAEAPKPDASKGPEKEAGTMEAPATTVSGRFTVQVGAYKAREPAEALRARLAATGHDAYVVETDGSAGVRFRVRVGVYDTREAAQEAAVRIAADRTLSTFVTAR